MSGTRIEFGVGSWCPPFQGPVLAAESEAMGFDVQYFGDNQCLTSDPFSELRAAAGATTTIRLATGVTNLVTRHPAVVASAMAAVQVCSGGRAICGVGKGDSALGMIGLGPQRHAEFTERLELLRAYLQGGTTRLGEWDSRLEWLDNVAYEPVPLQVMASGPKSLATAARFCDRISLGVGAAPERIRWALDIVDKSLVAAGRSRDDVTIGAQVNVVIHDDRDRALEQLRGRVKGYAHMASFPGHDLSTQPPIMRDVTSKLRRGYDYKHHNASADNPVAALVSTDFADWFGIGGSINRVVDRLAELASMGLSYFNFPGLLSTEKEQIATTVLPHFTRDRDAG
jgi:5,10-methylenetetrahydromethanopterin reductase